MHFVNVVSFPWVALDLDIFVPMELTEPSHSPYTLQWLLKE